MLLPMTHLGGEYGLLPAEPSFGAIWNPNSTNAPTGRRLLMETFRDYIAPEHLVETTPDHDETREKMVALFNRGLDVVLVLGGDGLLNAAAQAHINSDNRTTALAPGKTGGASDGHFMTQGSRFCYTPAGFANQPVGQVNPLELSVTSLENPDMRVTKKALLYASVAGIVTRVADAINSPGHRDLLHTSRQYDTPAREAIRRSAEAVAFVRALGEPRFIVGDESGNNKRMISDLVLVNGGRIAGALGTPGNLLDPELTHTLETPRRHELVAAAVKLLVGQSVQYLTAADKAIQFTILTGQYPGASQIMMMYDGETAMIPTRSLFTAKHSETSVPLVFAEEILRRSLRQLATRRRKNPKP